MSMPQHTWTPEDAEYLRQNPDKSLRELAAIIGSTPGSVGVYRRLLGVTRMPRRCKVCDTQIPPSTGGRRPKFCSPECKELDGRRRSRQAPKVSPEYVPCKKCGRMRTFAHGRYRCRPCDSAATMRRRNAKRQEQQQPD